VGDVDKEKLQIHISSLLRSSTSGIPGARLAAAIRNKFPGFSPADFGAHNLRDFLEKNVPEATIVARAGADIVYAAAESASSSTGINALQIRIRVRRECQRGDPSGCPGQRAWNRSVCPDRCRVPPDRA
jgi:hypothetical protein